MSSNTFTVKPRPEDVARAFLTPRPPAQRQALELEGGELLRIDTVEGEIAIQRAGKGPAVLLLHGWEGQAADLAGFAPRLLERGFTVLAMHLPAHGESGGKQTSIPHSARAVRAVVNVLGPLHGAIAHSVGCAVVVEALYAGLPLERAALIASPAYYERYARGFGAAAGLAGDDIEVLLGLLRQAIGVDVREISLPGRASHFHQPALFIHSADDRVVSIDESLAGAAAWRGARHVRVDGLGHKRILADPRVIGAAVEFISIPKESDT